MEFLKKYSKEDIIALLRQDPHYAFYNRLKESDIKHIKWNRLSRNLQERRERKENDVSDEDLKKRDALAIKFNAETDFDKRFSLLEEIAVYEKKIEKMVDTWKLIDKEQNKIDKLRDDLDFMQDKERNENNTANFKVDAFKIP